MLKETIRQVLINQFNESPDMANAKADVIMESVTEWAVTKAINKKIVLDSLFNEAYEDWKSKNG